jgi:hypothetical protein
MEAAIRDEGICRFCLKTFSGRSMARHLASCKVKKQKNAEEITDKTKTDVIYLIRLFSYKPYWLHIEIKSTATLHDLDKFLRDIWLECCGHLSAFTIGGRRYEASSPGYDYWGGKPQSVNVRLKKLLRVKDKFQYAYDFGSTTYVEGQVYAERFGILKDKMRILARNTPPVFLCVDCEAEATDICMECEEFYCEKCLAKHECEEEMALPVVNSPRMGVCGYAGTDDFDRFVPGKPHP